MSTLRNVHEKLYSSPEFEFSLGGETLESEESFPITSQLLRGNLGL
jgi:hypothetical protein